MTPDAVSVRLDAETLNGLARPIAKLNRSREHSIEDTVEKFIDDELASAFIEAGERDFEHREHMMEQDYIAKLRTRYVHKDAA